MLHSETHYRIRLLPKNRSIYLHDRKRHTRMICCDKKCPRGDLESSALHQTAEVTSLTATSWLLQSCFTVNCVSIPSQCKKAPQKNMARKFLHAYVHTFKPQAQASLLSNFPQKPARLHFSGTQSSTGRN